MSLIVGGILGVCLMLVIAMADGSGGPGRYQCCAAGDNSTVVFVLDTETGQVWRVGHADTVDLGTPVDRRSVRRSITPVVRVFRVGQSTGCVRRQGRGIVSHGVTTQSGLKPERMGGYG